VSGSESSSGRPGKNHIVFIGTGGKLLTEGKWVTHGILFDSGSDRGKGESYRSLKEIAGVLTESADLKVQIVDHTDSDGDDAANLDLSKRRAAARAQ